jgi:hypothetical protein
MGVVDMAMEAVIVVMDPLDMVDGEVAMDLVRDMEAQQVGQAVRALLEVTGMLTHQDTQTILGDQLELIPTVPTQQDRWVLAVVGATVLGVVALVALKRPLMEPRLAMGEAMV